jgi:hypothetical protein
METIKDLFKRLLDYPLPIRGPYRFAPDPISKKEKLPKSDFFESLSFPLLSICLAARSQRNCLENDV